MSDNSAIDIIQDDELAGEALHYAYLPQGQGINTLGTAATVCGTFGTAGCSKP